MSKIKHYTLVTWLVYLIAMLQRRHYVSNTAIAILLKILSVVLMELSKMYPQLSDISSILPTTVKGVVVCLKLKLALLCVMFPVLIAMECIITRIVSNVVALKKQVRSVPVGHYCLNLYNLLLASCVCTPSKPIATCPLRIHYKNY